MKTRRYPVAKPLSPADEAPLAAGAQLATATLGLLGLAGGWLILLAGGFHHQASRRSSETIWVDGGMALLMAMISLSLAATALAALLRCRRAPCRMWFAGLALVLLPPLFFVFSGGF